MEAGEKTMAAQTIPPLAPVDVSKYVEVRLFGERPHIRGRRLTVAMIAYNHRSNGWTVAETAYNFTISESEVLAALLYYEEYKSVIDAQEAEEIRLFDEAAAKYGND
jgi:uncharacterized protein (DUF433 family)